MVYSVNVSHLYVDDKSTPMNDRVNGRLDPLFALFSQHLFSIEFVLFY